MSAIRELHQQLTSKERTAVEIAQDYLQKIEALEPKLHSFLTVTADLALGAGPSGRYQNCGR
jgi:aspartyl-tRNA(Asn)/glutamyl-tRNA(Gln) amidotransferase subunit A